MDRKFFTAILLSIIVVGLVYLVYLVFRPFLLAMLWATVLVIVTYRAYEQMVRVVRGHRTVAAALMTVMVLVLIIGPFVTLLLFLVQDAIGFVHALDAESVKLSVHEALGHPWAAWALAKAKGLLQSEITSDRLAEIAKNILMPVIAKAGTAMLQLVNVFLALAIMLLAVFFFYRDGPLAVRALRELIPMKDEDRDAILGDMKGAINAAVRGGLVTALAQGVLGYIILFILGVERPVLLAALMALASLIPIVGTALVWLPLALYMAIFEGKVAHAAVLVGYGAIVIGMADNFLRPLLVGRHMEAHPLILFFGTLGGIAHFGFAGIVLGPVVVALMNVATRLFRREFRVVSPSPSPGPDAQSATPPPPAP